ncbi:MAG: hypothetical protein ACI9R3_003096 [Verrucomicrobiales bacterium]|jgi:hypothetical protein
MITISQPKLFKFLLVGLPIGLAISIVIAMILDVTEPGNGPEKQDALRFATPVSEVNLKNAVARLSGTVGARSLAAEPEAMTRARKFVQSSLGADNMGYKVMLVERKVGEIACPTVVAELTGRGRSSEIIVVAAPYTSAAGSPGAGQSGSGVAALLSLAKAMTGSEQQRTIRFVSYAAETADPQKVNLSAAVRHEEDRVVMAVVNLDTVAFPLREGGVWESEVPMIVYSNDAVLARDVTTRFARGTGLRLTPMVVAETSASQRSIVPFLTFVAETGEKSLAGSEKDVAGAYDYSRFTQAVQKLQRLIDRLANPDSV